MTDKEEIKFWLRAKRIIEEGYGANCKEIDIDCASCRAMLMIGWINKHLDLLEWDGE